MSRVDRLPHHRRLPCAPPQSVLPGGACCSDVHHYGSGLDLFKVEAHSRHAFVSGSFVWHSICEVHVSVAHSSFNFRAVFLPIYHCCLWAFGCFQFGAVVYKAAVNIFVLILGEGGPLFW